MVVATIHVGRRLGGVSANDQAVWVTNSGSQSAEKATLNRIDPATNAVTQSIKGPWLNVVLAQGDDVWVSGLDATVSRINAKSGDLMARIVVVPHSWKGLSGLAVSKGILWAADLEGSGLWKIDLKSNAVVGKFAVGNGPIIFGRGVDADGAIWVSNLRGGTVTRVQP
jgi:DNA-binding beta-propeller fold protein YncE